MEIMFTFQEMQTQQINIFFMVINQQTQEQIDMEFILIL